MDKILKNPELSGKIKAISSKSQAHRLLICAYLSISKSKIYCPDLNEDIKSTAYCLSQMGAKISYENGYYEITPPQGKYEYAEIDCGESGSTLRFLLPVCALCGKKTVIHMHARLPYRPIDPLKAQLEKYKVQFSGFNPLVCIGADGENFDFEIAADASSQYASGLLFAASKFGKRIKLNGKIQSKPYIDMTVDALEKFGAKIEYNDNGLYTIRNTITGFDGETLITEGDWSNAAFFIAAGVLGKDPITIEGLNPNSKQGDKAFIDILKQMGAKLSFNENSVTAYPSSLNAVKINAENIPDLVPILSVCASKAIGTTEICGVLRLKLKESDRIKTVCDMISNLGGKIRFDSDDTLRITNSQLKGGSVDSCVDHRIAMSAAIASLICENEVTISGAECTSKSYPTFWEEFERLKK